MVCLGRGGRLCTSLAIDFVILQIKSQIRRRHVSFLPLSAKKKASNTSVTLGKSSSDAFPLVNVVNAV